MPIMQSVKDWLKGCPLLAGRIDVDFLDSEADTYSVDTIPSEQVIKRYFDGSTRKQFQFAVSSRRFYSQNIAQNLDNLKFFEDLAEWVESKAQSKELPVLDAGKTAEKIVVTSTAYPFVISEDGKARYQLQFRLEYFHKRSV